MALFDAKIFNAEVFAKYTSKVQDLKKNELIKSGVLMDRSAELRSRFSDQVGGNYQLVPIKGLIGGDPVNYDGSTDITASSRKTYMQGMVVVGRAKGWTEKDFSSDITGGTDFMPVATEVAKYWQDVDQDILLSVLKGVFGMTGDANIRFVNAHTTNIVNDTTKTFGVTTLNNAIQKSSGDNKNVFSMAIMHSQVATNLENLQLLEYWKYTDANGVERQLAIATLNGRTVLVDDSVPMSPNYIKSTDTAVVAGKDYYTRAGSPGSYTYTIVAAPTGNPSTSDYYEVTSYDYTTYVFGSGAIEYGDFGAKVPSEMDRDPKTNGGESTLYTRQRKMFAPHGISFEASPVPISPTNAQLEAGANWTLVNDQSTGTKTYIDHKEIPIARIISRG